MDNGLQTLSGVLRGLPAVEYEVKVPEEETCSSCIRGVNS